MDKKGFTLLIILCVITGCLLVLGSYFIWKNNTQKPTIALSGNSTSTFESASNPAPINSIASTSPSGNKTLFNFEDVAMPYIMNGDTTGTIEMSFKVVRLHSVASAGNPTALGTKGIDFTRDGLAETIVNAEKCPATVVSSIEGETVVATSSVKDKWEPGDQWTVYTLKLQPSCPLNIGNTFLQFYTSGAAASYDLGTIGITVYVSPTVPKPRVVVLNDPAANIVSVARGSDLNLNWYTSGGEASDTIRFYLYSTSTDYSGSKLVSADQGSLALPIVVPTGGYLLTGYYDYVGGYTTSGVYYGTEPVQTEARISRVITVMVTGPQPSIVTESSSLDIVGNDNIIPADGICKAPIYASIVDRFGFGIAGRTILLRSSRSDDSIIAESSSTDTDGQLSFTVTSHTIGTSTLSASVDGLPIGAVTLSFIDPTAGPCITSFNEYD